MRRRQQCRRSIDDNLTITSVISSSSIIDVRLNARRRPTLGEPLAGRPHVRKLKL